MLTGDQISEFPQGLLGASSCCTTFGGSSDQNRRKDRWIIMYSGKLAKSRKLDVKGIGTQSIGSIHQKLKIFGSHSLRLGGQFKEQSFLNYYLFISSMQMVKDTRVPEIHGCGDADVGAYACMIIDLLT
ncbi:hypothetical protein L6452_07355 [Arctium lappa]|uniref:Uncharacterized protein n=1 Tax=Arctium lappa TaxID=4217 RepID=A0ACB9EL92_ARCLA|nr:hypothetical protein L6452_07355 [Arctium lappa]